MLHLYYLRSNSDVHEFGLKNLLLPSEFENLRVYIENWSITDETARYQLIKKSDTESLKELINTIIGYKNQIDTWLDNKEDNKEDYIDEYASLVTIVSITQEAYNELKVRGVIL